MLVKAELDVFAITAYRAEELFCRYRACLGTCVSKFKWTVMEGKMNVLALLEHPRCALHVLVGAGLGVYVGYRLPEPSLIPHKLVLFGCWQSLF